MFYRVMIIRIVNFDEQRNDRCLLVVADLAVSFP